MLDLLMDSIKHIIKDYDNHLNAMCSVLLEEFEANPTPENFERLRNQCLVNLQDDQSNINTLLNVIKQLH